MSDIGRQIRDLEEIAAYFRAEIRRAERDRVRIPGELTEKIVMLGRSANAIESYISSLQDSRRVNREPSRGSRASTLSFPFSEGQRLSFGSSRGGGRGTRTWRP
ncbi:uncharacterized protein LOC117653426 [Thrips palmi]|uniref:Uncharacterized protein LOC117653426 n=1 Tax=Thrips palmi TaxID=161013 RepID=A0A6P9AA60_THRPL|nr:uncharacterized protein LOC117653426 [Thrips palmi]